MNKKREIIDLLFEIKRNLIKNQEIPWLKNRGYYNSEKPLKKLYDWLTYLCYIPK